MNIVEFSKIAGLSTATVSRAFHEPEKIRAETRRRVLELADQYGYYPSASGRALVKGRHDTLGLVWPLEVEGAGAPFAMRILAALTQQLVDNDLDLLICPIDRRSQKTLEHSRNTVLRSRCDAWILLYPRHNDLLIDSLRKSGKPVICLMGGLEECPDWKCVALEQSAWINDALGLLKKGGARRVLFAGCRQEEPDHRQRLQAFACLAPKHFGKNHASLPHWPLESSRIYETIVSGNIDAIVGVDDAAALTAMQACREHRLSIPRDIQIIGIDDSADAACAVPKLATYRQPLSEMAACAVDLALGKRLRSRQFAATFVSGESIREPHRL